MESPESPESYENPGQQQLSEYPESHKTVLQRFMEKLSRSRFFTISMMLHAVIVGVVSTIIIETAKEPPASISSSVASALPDDERKKVDEVDITLPQSDIKLEAIQPPAAPPMGSMPNVTIPAVNNPAITVSGIHSIKPGDRMVVAMKSPGTGGVANPMSGVFAGRNGQEGRETAAKINGQKPSSEKAVMNGLRWLAANQNPDGSWGTTNKHAMTGLAALCFLGHGETPERPEFGPTIKKGLDWLLERAKANGSRMVGRADGFSGQPDVYEHAIATYAMGEYYAMTKDGRFKDVLTEAIGYIVKGQNTDGGWQYSYAKGQDSDTSVSGWQIQALKAAHLTGMKIPGVDDALDKAMINLKRVKGPKGGYGYRQAEDRYSLTGVGVLCTYFWKSDKPEVSKGIKFILEESRKNRPVKYDSDKADLYAWYYHTNACLMFGDSAWQQWNAMFQDEVTGAQNPDGSWPYPPNGKTHGSNVGPVYPTTLCVLMLEAFYRYMPSTR